MSCRTSIDVLQDIYGCPAGHVSSGYLACPAGHKGCPAGHLS